MVVEVLVEFCMILHNYYMWFIFQYFVWTSVSADSRYIISQ